MTDEQSAHKPATETDGIRLRGDGINVNRYRARSGEPHEVTLYVDVEGEHTVAQLVAFLLDHAGMRRDMGNAIFRGGCFRVTVPATPEDIAAWERADAEREARGRASRRAWYERLRAEFEGEPSENPTPPGTRGGGDS